MSVRSAFCVALLAPLLWAAPASAARRDLLLVVNRQAAADGAAVADAFRRARDIGDDFIVTIDVPPGETVSRQDYLARVERPVAAWLQRHAAHDEITYIVLTRGVPLRVAADAATRVPLGSVDSNLALLYRKLTGAVVGPGPLPNPAFVEAPSAAGTWPAFDRAALDVFIVTRLDAFTTAEAVALATRCGPAPAAPRVVLDGRTAGESPEHRWFPLAAARLRAAGGGTTIVDVDQTAGLVTGGAPAIAYVAWGAADPAQRFRTPSVPLAPGAVGASLSSSDVRTFKEPPLAWQPGAWTQQDRRFEGTADWLAGDLVRAGITGWGGAVADPYVDGVVRPHVLVPAYLSGLSLGEAYLRATKYVGWRTVILGDPLCRPCGREAAPVTFARHESSGLTRPFFDRLLVQARRQAAPGTTVDSLEVLVSAQARMAQGDRPAGVALMRAWLADHPADLPVRQLMALSLDPVTERDEAIASYRAVLALQPADLVASNNLAYALATDPAGRAEALTLARRVYDQTRGEPTVADTYGWVLYQTGDVAEAARVLREAVRRAPGLVEAQIHLALVLLKSNERVEARQAWEAAQKVAPDVASRPEAAPLVEAFGTGAAGPVPR
ncbi:TIGR03790 family protein [Luteitalea sp.]